MGTDTAEKPKHNPDADNLKSLLKKPPSKRDATKRPPHRVVFNETRNEFFDADYIILIREECDLDEDDDDDDDGGVCTCYQQEMVRLACREPDCDCAVYEEQSPKFAPPIEFVDAVTLSPPEGYKDMEMIEQEMMAYEQMAMRGEGVGGGRGAAVCRDCISANQEFEADEGDNSQPHSDINKPKIDLGQKQEDEEDGEKEKIDQSQQTTPTSPNSSDGQNYLLDSPALVESKPPEENSQLPLHGSPVAGILKGGKLWRQQSLENNALKANEQVTKADSVSDDESSTTRTVRFIEEEKKDSCKSSPESERQIEGKESSQEDDSSPSTKQTSVSDSAAEMMLTFKLGNHILISNNSLKPNSAVRQLFPCTKPLGQHQQQQQQPGEDDQQYLVTAESLRAFEEAKRSKLPQIIQSGGTTDSIKRVIERNTLRRSLLRYEPKNKRNVQKTDNSLVERIKQLTCDIDEVSAESDELSARVSPTGEEENAANAPDPGGQDTNKTKERNFSPSSSSTASSNSSSMSSTYKKITDLFGKIPPDTTAEAVTYEPKGVQTLPDLGGPYTESQDKVPPKPTPIAESRKQFLSTLAPLTACVGHAAHRDDHYYHLSNNHHHQQGSGGGSTGSEYTLDDIDEALADDETKKITPDVLAGTPASESGDELLVFVQQDANRIERIKKKYESDPKKDEDDEHDDYGFNRRPSVRGIKPRFGSTSEILQQIQNHIHLPAPNANAAWPYYSETGLNREEDSNKLNAKQNNVPYQYVTEEGKATRGYVPQAQYNFGPVNLQDNQYQNCGNPTYYQEVYKTHSAVIGVEIDCQTLSKSRTGRPLSPPPQELSRNYHQTMVYIPYNNIEGYQPVITANAYNDYYRYSHNQVNKKYIEPVYQQKLPEDPYCNSNVPTHKMLGKSPYSNNYQPLLVPSSRSESPLMGNYAMARGTQTPSGCITSCNYYQNQPSMTVRYRDSLLRPQYNHGNKVNRHSFPSVRPRYYSPDSSEHLVYPEDHNPNHNGHMMNGYYNYYTAKESPASSPTKTRYIERGVPEGAASVSPQDSMNTASTNTSPTLSQSTSKPMFYAMNV